MRLVLALALLVSSCAWGAECIQGSGNYNAGSPIAAPAFGAGVTSGNSAIVTVWRTVGSNALNSVTDNQAGTYTLDDTVTLASGNLVSVFSRHGITDAPTTFTATFAGGGVLAIVVAFECEPLGAFVDGVHTTGADISLGATLSNTVAAAGALLVGTVSMNNSRTLVGVSGASVVGASSFGTPPPPSNGWGVWRETSASGSQSADVDGTDGGSGYEYALFAYEGAAAPPTAPELTSVTPDTFEDGETGIVIAGTDFEASQGSGFVTVCPTDDITDMDCELQTVTSWGATSITFAAVLGGGLTEDVTSYLFVENDTGDSNEDGFEVEFESADIVATKLIFGSQPGNVIVGQTFGAFTVRAVDGDDVLDESVDANVTVALQTGNGSLAGTLTEAAVAGIATFDDVHIDTLNTDAVIRATSAGLTAADSDEFDVTAGEGGGAVGIPATSTLGGALQR